MYKKVNDLITEQEDTTVIMRKADNAFIPVNNANRDYQEYLEWVAEGNEPEPAE